MTPADARLALAPCSSSLSRRRRSASSAFTLLEILIALAILGMLVALSITKLGSVFGGAQSDTAKLFVDDSMKTALTTYRIQVGDYPSTEEGLAALVTPPSGKEDRWHGPYIDAKSVPLDPWKHPYKYAYPGTHNKDGYDLWSTGPDGIDGTADDVGNW
ncbi:MAG TPA: type II secretion system major pseudopilin GspG [Opitutaceae bacterium]|nr:type II secretion system major pseudopilin GspG [Opitutaceae bacterium]